MRRLVRTKEDIRKAAHDSLRAIYANRDKLIGTGASPEQVLANASQLIASSSDFEIVRSRELPTQSIEDRVFSDEETAGIIDRRGKRIYIATRFPPRTQRFTLAHEIGHLILHPLELYHRDRPLVGGSRSNVPLVEREADTFAAELLMPAKHLRNVFEGYFAGIVNGEHADDALAYNLSLGTKRRLSPSQLIQMKPFERALLFARCSTWGGRALQPLVDRYDVSSTAMAWQRIDHGLVS